MGTKTQMIEIIKQIPNYQSLTAQQIQDYFAVVEEVPNQKLYDGKAFEDLVTSKVFSLEEVNIILGTMKASPLFEMAFIGMSTGEALEFYSDVRQGLIRQLAAAAGWPDEFRDRVLALGRTTQARYLTMGFPSLPTIEQIEDALNPDFDSESVEVLFSLNRQANGQTFVVMRSTPVKLRNGVVVERGEGTNVMDSPLLTQIKELIEASL
jgi:hypothetical protein